MANTQNLDLVKPIGTDHALVSDINGNSDKIDAYAGAVNASLDGLRDGLGILADGNTHAAITSGQFVYVKNHQTLPQGLYQATTNIAANGTLSTSNLTADPKGGLNTLSEQIATLNSKITTKVTDVKSQIPCDWANIDQAIRLETGNLIEYQFIFVPLTDAGIEMARRTVVCPGCPTSCHAIFYAVGNNVEMGGGFTVGLTIPGFFAPWENGVVLDLGYVNGKSEAFVDSTHIKYFQLNVLMLKIE